MRSTSVGLTVAVAALLVFLGLAWEVHTSDSAVCRFDRTVAAAMKEHAARHPGLLFVARHLTDAGGVPVMTALAIIGALSLWLCGRHRLATYWLLAAALGCIANVSSKEVFGRHRPDEALRDSAVHERNASFPSGHAMGAAIGYGTLACVGAMLLRRHAAKVALALALALLVLLIGASRIYLRAHWFSDVVGGYAIGMCWLSLCILVLRRARRT
jgi:undecaprenyl-diphosphatase